MDQIDFATLCSKLDKLYISTDILLGSVKLLDSSSRNTASFNDNRYLPFYYYLGKEIKHPISVIQIGTKLGLVGACFMQGCSHVADWHAIEDGSDQRFPTNIIKSNLKKYCKGISDLETTIATISDDSSEDDFYDIAFLSEKYDKDNIQSYLEFLWHRLKPEGLLVVDYIQNEVNLDVFKGFCRVKNREPKILDTRYGVGIIVR